MMEAGQSDFTQTAVEMLGELLIDALAEIPDSKAAQRTRDAAQVTLVGLGNLAALNVRTDLRPLLYDLSDRTGGNQRT